jgi:hypothetical protein
MLRHVFTVPLILLILSAALQAEEIAAAKIVSMEKGKVTFTAGSKEQTLTIGRGLKFFDTTGKELSLEEGLGILQAGNVVNLVTAKDDTSPQPRIVSVVLVSGSIAQPMIEQVDLRPDPKFPGDIEVSSLPDAWLAYFPTAKVGDFAEYKGFGRVRHEVLAVEGDTITVARVVDTRGARSEFRTKFTITMGQKRTLDQRAKEDAEANAKPKKKTSSKKQKLTPAREREQAIREKNRLAREAEAAARKAETEWVEKLTIGDREVECNAEKEGSQSTIWKSAEVPFDGLVKQQRPNDNLSLTSFGRGK